MRHHSVSEFMTDQGVVTPAEWLGGALQRVRWTKTYTGDLVGTSVVEAITARMDDNGPMVYVAIERFVGTVGRRQGTFTLTHAATVSDGAQRGSWLIVAGSGTGDLAGIHGQGAIGANHEFTLDYEFAVAD